MDAQIAEIRSLRARGLSPKEIARVLRISPAVASRLVREAAAEEAATLTEHPIRGCWVNAGWSQGLTFDPRPEWADTARDDAGFGGVASVLVVRDAGRSRLSVCGYLVDLYCLGVKNVIGPELMDTHQCDDFVRMYFGAYDDPPLAVPLDLAQELVLGAVAYARTLGFQPHHGFEDVREHLGAWTGPGAITFGRDGKPFYVQGPFDDADRIMRRLERSAAGKFHYMVSV